MQHIILIAFSASDTSIVFATKGAITAVFISGASRIKGVFKHGFTAQWNTFKGNCGKNCISIGKCIIPLPIVLDTSNMHTCVMHFSSLRRLQSEARSLANT